MQRPTTIEILEQLISLATVSRQSNMALMRYVTELLATQGIVATLDPHEDGSRANLYASVGPTDRGGVMLSGHTDVVPVDGQHWTVPPFKLSHIDDRYFGRGTADMKGFVACAISAMLDAASRRLLTPLHLALSYDEEIGCIGVRSLISQLAQGPTKARLCIVGEPTELAVAVRHKGKMAIRVDCTGQEGHSALAPHALNAIHLACDFINKVRELQASLATPLERHDVTRVPYTTVHIAAINAGGALNIVPNRCSIDMEIRHTAEDDPAALLALLQTAATTISSAARERFPHTGIELQVHNSYPGLDTPQDTWAVDFVKSLSGANECTEVSYGTEAGLFSERLGVPSVVCGPGSMAQGHKPDEYISGEQLAACDAMLGRLLERLEQGI